jgi:SAM-dependent methyltransferase
MTDRADAYRHIAAHYELHGCDWYAQAFGPRLLRLLEERGYAGSRLLDAGCGTGTLALSLLREGHKVTGIDLSGAMLDIARAKDPEGRIAWQEADVTDFDLGAQFDVVTCVGDTLNHLARIDEWEAAFTSFARHLRPGGALYFDVMTRKGLEWLDTYQVIDRENRVLVLGFIYEPATGRSTMKMTSFRRIGDGSTYERASDTVTEWGQPVDAIFDVLKRAGFAAPERLWGRAERPEDDERLTVIATRV